MFFKSCHVCHVCHVCHAQTLVKTYSFEKVNIFQKLLQSSIVGPALRSIIVDTNLVYAPDLDGVSVCMFVPQFSGSARGDFVGPEGL